MREIEHKAFVRKIEAEERKFLLEEQLLAEKLEIAKQKRKLIELKLQYASVPSVITVASINEPGNDVV